MVKLRKSLMAKSVLSVSIIMVLVVLVLTVISYFRSTQVLTTEIEKNLSLQLEQVKTHVLLEQNALENQIKFVSNLSIIKDSMSSNNANNSMVESILKDYAKLDNSLVENIFIVNSDGIISYDNVDGSMKGIDIHDRGYFIDSMAGNISWSDVIVSRATGNRVQAVSSPIIGSDGAVLGVVAASINFDYVAKILTDIKVGENGYAYLVDQAGNLIFHPKPDYLGKHLSEFEIKELTDGLPAMLKGENGKMTYTHAGITKLNMYIGLNNWSLSINAAEKEFMAPINQMRNSLIVVGIICIILGIVVSAFNSHLMIKKIKRVSNIIGLAAQGDIKNEIPEDHLRKCWEIKNCKATDCPAYGNQNRKCWEMTNTLCRGEKQENLALKLAKCKECKTYQLSEGDELKQIDRGLNTMFASTRLLINDIKNVSISLASSSQQLSGNSEESNAGSEEIATSIDEINLGAQEQSNSAVMANNLVVQMNELLKRCKNSIMEMSKRTDGVLTTAAEGQSTILNTINEMNDIKDGSEKTVKVMETLSEQSKEIDKINSAITQIAQQTNLLALNASIEAARAGEHGKGFAVVADEIRKLAAQSQESAQGIQSLIKEIQHEITAANELITDENQMINKGIASVKISESAFSEISNHIDQVVSHIKEVVTSIEETQVSSNQVFEAVEKIVSSVQQTAAGTEEINATTEEQSSISEEIAQSAAELAHMSEGLIEYIERFKTN